MIYTVVKETVTLIQLTKPDPIDLSFRKGWIFTISCAISVSLILVG